MEEDGGEGETRGRGVVRVSGGMWLERGGRKKNGVGRIFRKVILIDALRRYCIEEWIGIGLRVRWGVY